MVSNVMSCCSQVPCSFCTLSSCMSAQFSLKAYRSVVKQQCHPHYPLCHVVETDEKSEITTSSSELDGRLRQLNAGSPRFYLSPSFMASTI